MKKLTILWSLLLVASLKKERQLAWIGPAALTYNNKCPNWGTAEESFTCAEAC